MVSTGYAYGAGSKQDKACGLGQAHWYAAATQRRNQKWPAQTPKMHVPEGSKEQLWQPLAPVRLKA